MKNKKLLLFILTNISNSHILDGNMIRFFSTLICLAYINKSRNNWPIAYTYKKIIVYSICIIMIILTLFEIKDGEKKRKKIDEEDNNKNLRINNLEKERDHIDKNLSIKKKEMYKLEIKLEDEIIKMNRNLEKNNNNFDKNIKINLELELKILKEEIEQMENNIKEINLKIDNEYEKFKKYINNK